MNHSIKTRLLGGFSVIVLLLIVVGLLMSNKLSETNGRLENLVDVSSKRINLSHELLILVLDAGRHEKNIILEKDPVKKDYYKDRIYQPLGIIDKKMNELFELSDEKGKAFLNEFNNSWSSYKADLDEIVLLALKNEDEKAFRISIDKGAKVRDAAITQLQKIVEKNEKSMANDKAVSDQSYKSSLNLVITLIIAALILSIGIAYWIIQGITKRITSIAFEAEKIASREFTNEKLEDKTKDELRPIVSSLININESFREVTENANKVSSGNFAVEIIPRSEKDILGNALKKMTISLRETTAENEKHTWLTTGQNRLNEKLRGDQGIEELASNTIAFLCGYLKANIGSVYLLNEKENTLTLSGQYAFSSENGNGIRKKFNSGEGLIGQVAHEQKQMFLTDIKDEDIRIVSSVLDAKPRHLIITPFMFEGKTLGVIELGRLTDFTGTEKEFIKSSMESIGISINSAISRKRIQELLEETQVQSEELQSQQEELRQVNEELEEQTQNLKQQQEELQMTNEELEEQTQALEVRNKEVESARGDIEQKTRQLEISSRYKSEFLANMSHELRTPLNSLLILSKDLSDNKSENLTKEQVESAGIIYKSGQDLLTLINEVLDLSKIEAGKMVLNIEKLALKKLADGLYGDFKHQAEQKGLGLNVNISKQLPEYIHTDPQRLNQILKNLLSNAVKFTEQGSITVNIYGNGENKIAISVTDTGIGISQGKQLTIFEAFQQGDGSTSRKYGGTGLGLSISRELAKLLNGEITLTSKTGEGSTFTLVIPQEIQHKEAVISIVPEDIDRFKKVPVNANAFLNYPAIEDDRKAIGEDDKIVLVIEDDLKFAEILLKQAHNKGFKCLAAATGEDGLVLAEKYLPHAVILDIDLPGISGYKVLSQLKSNPFLRHIPVHIMSVEERSLKPIKEGAVEYLNKPINKRQLDEAFNRIENFIDRKMKHLLIVEDDENSRKAIQKLIGNGDVRCFEAGTGKEALAIFEENHIDCIVLDIGLPDVSGFELIRKFEKKKEKIIPPVIVYTGKELTREENAELQKYAETIIIKGVKSEERLLDETALFLHRTISNLPETKQRLIASLYDKDIIFKGKKILLADDDMRNVFALSKILKEYGMEVIKAENGINALEILDRHGEIDLVLMDIMMPEMDGFEAMRKIRLQPKFKQLPVIAVTAKAMKEDKQKCIDAGANDYISKPVEVDRLLSLMRVWLSK
ncbi:response regulator [Terrimonas pollutisoli]|uniref:response regulator n=1 Tax=Terrimonas pollutisoli TaxID=3034147 RepID=UPI0023EB3A4B|nr:response regulator [Terrimonas sp. H1YJ31]